MSLSLWDVLCMRWFCRCQFVLVVKVEFEIAVNNAIQKQLWGSLSQKSFQNAYDFDG